jgi:hypothetical protein
MRVTDIRKTIALRVIVDCCLTARCRRMELVLVVVMQFEKLVVVVAAAEPAAAATTTSCHVTTAACFHSGPPTSMHRPFNDKTQNVDECCASENENGEEKLG